MNIYNCIDFGIMTGISTTLLFAYYNAKRYSTGNLLFYEDNIVKKLKFMERLEKDYSGFKRAIVELVNANHLSDEEIDRNYLYIKAKFYNIDVDKYKKNPFELEQEIERIEGIKVDSRRDSYYSRKDRII